MFSKGAVRSRKQIQKGLLSRAFERGGKVEQEKMQLLIEWRIAACRHAVHKSLEELESKYNLKEFNDSDYEDSRYLSAYNLTQHMDGNGERLKSAPRQLSEKDILDFASVNNEVKAALKSDIIEKDNAVAKHNHFINVIWGAPKINLEEVKRQSSVKPFDTAPEYKTYCLRDATDVAFIRQPNDVSSLVEEVSGINTNQSPRTDYWELSKMISTKFH